MGITLWCLLLHNRRAVFLFALCSCDLSCCCNRIPGKSGKQCVERVVVPHAVQVQSIMVEWTRQLECEVAAYIVVHSEEADRCCCARLVLCIQFRTPGHWGVLPTV